MRVLPAIAAFACMLSLEAMAQTSLVGQSDTARPGGVYTNLSVPNAAACAQLCSEDGICLAWTFRAARNGACELKAVAPNAVSEIGAVSGLSSRAPEFTRRLAASAPPESASPQTAAADEASTEPLSLINTPQSEALLGGPTALSPISLRPRLEEDQPRR